MDAKLFLNLVVYFLFFKDFIYLFIDRGEGKEKEREASKYGCFSCSPNLACNPRMFPDWESNLRPFSLQASAQSIEPHQPGLVVYFLNILFIYF